MEKTLSGKVALITGGSRGIGKAIALSFAKSGASVVINYFKDKAHAEQTEKELRALGAPVLLHQADVRQYEAVAQMMQEAQKKFGKIHFLINNAGITRDKTLKKMALEDWHDVLNTNLTGAFNCCKAALDCMELREGSRIVNISSVIAETGNFGQVNYAAAKAGLLGLTRSLALELARSNVTVNAVAPGFTKTEMFDQIPKDIQDQIIQKIPLKRAAKPEEIAALVLYLCSEPAGFITGAVLDINGGGHLHA